MAKVWKLYHSLYLRYATAFFQNKFLLESGFLSFLELQSFLLISFQGYWTQWISFESSNIHCFWDTPQHFLKTHFCWENGFLSLLEHQKCLWVSFQGVLNKMAKVWKLYPSPFLIFLTVFTKNTFLLRKWLPVIPRSPEMPTSKLSRMLSTMAKLWKL